MDLWQEFLKAYHGRDGAVSPAGSPSLPAAMEAVDGFAIAVINQKGGCGKTTTCVNLSATLAEMGYRVLLVDLDPQAHSTLGLGVQSDALDLSVYHLLFRPELRTVQTLQQTYHRNLKLLPANGLLAAAQLELMSLPRREFILKDRLEELKGFFQFILMDCPPSLNLITLNALTAVSHLLIPIQTQYYSLDGMKELFRTIEMVRKNSNPDLDILGILPTLYDPRTKLNRAMLKALQEYFRDRIFGTTVQLNAALAECPMMGQPVTRYAPGSRGAADYRRLAEEVIARAAKNTRPAEHSEKAV